MAKKVMVLLAAVLCPLVYQTPIKSAQNQLQDVTCAPKIVSPKKFTLHKATREEDLQAVKELILKYPEDINQQDESGNTPVHYAAEEGYTAILKELIDNGADINLKNKWGECPIHKACLDRNLEIITLLTTHKADIETKNFEGNTALHIASSSGYVEILLFLLAQGAKINQKNSYGETILHLATQDGNNEIIRALLDKNIAIDATNNKGETALHLAVENGDLKTVKLLIEHGANSAQRNFWGLGRTALEIALKKKDFATVFYLNFVSNFQATLNNLVPFIQFATYYLTPEKNRFDDTRALLPLDKQGKFTKNFNTWCEKINKTISSL